MGDFNSSLPVIESEITGIGTIAANGGKVVASTSGKGTIIFNITGIWSGTLQVQGNNGDGVFTQLVFFSNANGLYNNTSTTVNAFIIVNAAAWYQIQVIATAWTSGTATVSWGAGPFVGKEQVYSQIAAGFLSQAWLFDGSGNSISSTSGSLNVNVTNGTEQTPVNANSKLSPTQSVTTTESSLVAPTNAIGVMFESDSSNTTNIRWGISNSTSSILSSTLGLLMEPGRDSGFLPVGAGNYLHFIALSGTVSVNVQWILTS
jgi:hypothetical protein